MENFLTNPLSWSSSSILSSTDHEKEEHQDESSDSTRTRNQQEQEPTDSQDSEEFMILDDTVDNVGDSDEMVSSDCIEGIEQTDCEEALDALDRLVSSSHDQPEDDFPTDSMDRQSNGVSASIIPDDAPPAPAAEQPIPISKLVATLNTAASVLRTQNDLLQDNEEKREKDRAAFLKKVDRMGSQVSDLENFVRSRGIHVSGHAKGDTQPQTLAQNKRSSRDPAGTRILHQTFKIDRRAEEMLGNLASNLQSTDPNSFDSPRREPNNPDSDRQDHSAVIDLTSIPDDSRSSSNYQPDSNSSNSRSQRLGPLTRSQTGNAAPRTARSQHIASNSRSRSSFSGSTGTSTTRMKANSSQKVAKKGSRTFNGRTRLSDRSLRLGMSDGVARVPGAMWPPKKPATVKSLLQTMRCDSLTDLITPINPRCRVHWACAGFEEDEDMSTIPWDCPDCRTREQQGDDSEPDQPDSGYCIRPDCVMRAKQKIENMPGDEDIYVIESIIGKKQVPSSVPGKKRYLYLVKWLDWPLETSTWEPADNIFHLDNMLFEFHQDAHEFGLDPRPKVVLFPEAREFWDENGDPIARKA
ncbi:hypothetical protein IAU59_005849 [Kwoniella sp. CBS 9459]